MDASWMQWSADPAGLLVRSQRRAAPPGSRERTDSRIAVVATVLMHVGLLALLRHASLPAIVPSGQGRGDAVEVIWIVRDQRSVSTTTVHPPQESTSAAVSSPPARSDKVSASAVPVAASDHAAATTTALRVVEDDAWQVLPRDKGASASDIDPSAFRRDPLAKRETDFDPGPAALEDAIQDRSFGGWMQAATRKRMCGDLRAALRRSAESTGSIIESMRRRGCKV